MYEIPMIFIKIIILFLIVINFYLLNFEYFYDFSIFGKYRS
jgi:hypothetical protein